VERGYPVRVSPYLHRASDKILQEQVAVRSVKGNYPHNKVEANRLLRRLIKYFQDGME
jgi:hypothetical protein